MARWVGRAIGLDVHRDFCVVAICEDGVTRSPARAAEQLMRARTRVKNEIHASLHRRRRSGRRALICSGSRARQWLAGLELALEERESVDAGITIEFLDSEIAAVSD